MARAVGEDTIKYAQEERPCYSGVDIVDYLFCM